MSQCPHCRGLRKSRASHVKCGCGEKPHSKEDCVLVEKGDSTSELGDYNLEPVSDNSTVDHHVCCCSHGARCSCALKKEHLEPVPELGVNESTLHRTEPRKPRLVTAQSDDSLMVFANGHHKPVHKHNDAAHKCGLPYKIPRPHSIHGHSEVAQRSMDNLPLLRTSDEATLQLQESILSAQQDVRLVRSEHGTPEMRATANIDQSNDQLPPLDLSFPTLEDITSSPIHEDHSQQPSSGFESYFATPEEQPVLSAGLNMPVVDWSAFDLPFDNRSFAALYSQPPSYASFDHSNIGQPGLTTSSSGEVSEVDDYMAQALPSPGLPDNTQYTSNISGQADAESYRLSTASSYLSMPQTSLLASSIADNLDIDAILQGVTSSPATLKDYDTRAPMDPASFAPHGLTVQDAQKLAHPGVPVRAMGDLSLPASRDNPDLLWAASFDKANVPFDPELEGTDGLWSS